MGTQVVAIRVRGEEYVLDGEETRELVGWLREAAAAAPHSLEFEAAAIATAVHLERALDEPETHDPLLTSGEEHVLLAVLDRRSGSRPGLTTRLARFHAALERLLGGRHVRESSP